MSAFRLILRSGPKGRVSKDKAASSFETRSFGALIRMRPEEAARNLPCRPLMPAKAGIQFFGQNAGKNGEKDETRSRQHEQGRRMG